MKAPWCSAVAAIALILGVSTATAASSAMTKYAQNSLSLNSLQRQDIYQDVSKLKTNQPAPTGFSARVGATVPNSVKLELLPQSAINHVPAVKFYNYAMLEGEVLIVNPNTMEIADVITQ